LSVLSILVGCVEVSGGAVELSWTIRDIEGKACSCGESAIESVELLATPCDELAEDGSCLGDERVADTWPCDALRGSTAFDIPEGRWAFEIRAVVTDPIASDPREPSPIIRDVLSGEVTHLDALLIEHVAACQQ
jgi:hypothetical protein